MKPVYLAYLLLAVIVIMLLVAAFVSADATMIYKDIARPPISF